MDPHAGYERFLAALAEGNRTETQDAHDDLCTWLRNGGFEPAWTADERRAFFAHGLRLAAGA